MKKLLTFFLLALLTFGVGWAETVTLSNANIVAAGAGSTGYQSWTITDGNNNTWKAYAIKNQHSNATSGYHYLQIKKYASNTAYYIQVPELGTKITQIVMTVSSSSQPMTGGGNTATLYFSNSNSTSATGTGVASGTGASSVTIDCSSLNLNSGYITASAGVRIWDVKVTYTAGSVTPTCETPTFSPGEGTYNEAQSVTISTTTSGASIYYTIDGSTPSATNGTLYTEAIDVSETTTIKAIAVKAGNNDSQVAEATYTIISGSGSDSKIYRKVTSTDDLVAGQKYIIVYENGSESAAMGAYKGGLKDVFSAVTGLNVSNHQINIANVNNVLELYLDGTTDAWTLNTGDGFIQGNDGVNFSIVSSVGGNTARWVISADGIVQNKYYPTRYIKYYVNTPSFRHYTTVNGEVAYLYVQASNNEPTLHATPNPLNINDTNETGGKTGTILVSGENLGNDNVGMTFNQNHSTNFSSNPGYFSHNGTVTDYPVAITYTGHALSATGIVYPANNVVSTSVNINYLYTGPIYVIGDVNNTYWNTNNGAQMTRDENGVYSTTVSVQQSDGTAGYITFTKQLGSSFADGQFGPVSSGNWWYNDGLNDIYQPIDTLGNKNNIRILPGTYTITVNPATNEFKIKRYVINVTITPADGTHFTGSTISGTITSDPAGTIEWTTDGNNWQTYTDGFTATVDQVGGSVTVYARSTSNGVTSDVVSATYTRDLAPAPEAPSFSIGSSSVAAGTVITITAPAGCTLYVDGQQVTNPYDVTINEATTITACCVNDEGTHSETVTNSYTIAAVCNAIIEFNNYGIDSNSEITTNSIQEYYNSGSGYIYSASDISKVFKGKTGLKFGNSDIGGTITFILDGNTEWKVSHITLNAKNYSSNEEVTFTVSTDNGQSKTTSAIGSTLGGYTLDFNGSAITSITISSSARAYLKGFTITYDCGPSVVATLAEIESDFSVDSRVTVSDELIGVWAVVNYETGDRFLWAKDQGNVSIDRRPRKTDGQIDYVGEILAYSKSPYVEDADEWDESNWVILDFSELPPIDGEDADYFNPDSFVGHRITGGTVTGKYVDDVNYKIVLQQEPELVSGDPYAQDVPVYPGWTEPFSEYLLGADHYYLAYNTYVPANFMPGNHNDYDLDGNVVGGFVADETALPGLAGDSLYFVNPKIQEVAHIWAVWCGNDSETGQPKNLFSVYKAEHKQNENINAWNLNGTFRVKWDYNCKAKGATPEAYGPATDLVEGVAYEFHAAIFRPTDDRPSRLRADEEPTPQGILNEGLPSTAYVLYPLDIKDGGTWTAVNELNNNKTVVGVSYYNLMGIESKKPFDGVNIVVTRYSDGTTSTTKVLR